jgi:hypothetical protein
MTSYYFNLILTDYTQFREKSPFGGSWERKGELPDLFPRSNNVKILPLPPPKGDKNLRNVRSKL